MARRVGFKQIDVTRAIKGAQAAGLKPTSARVDPATGEIEMTFGSEASSTGNSFDALLSGQR